MRAWPALETVSVAVVLCHPAQRIAAGGTARLAPPPKSRRRVRHSCLQHILFEYCYVTCRVHLCHTFICSSLDVMMGTRALQLSASKGIRRWHGAPHRLAARPPTPNGGRRQPDNNVASHRFCRLMLIFTRHRAGRTEPSRRRRGRRERLRRPLVL